MLKHQKNQIKSEIEPKIHGSFIDWTYLPHKIFEFFLKPDQANWNDTHQNKQFYSRILVCLRFTRQSLIYSDSRDLVKLSSVFDLFIDLAMRTNLN